MNLDYIKWWIIRTNSKSSQQRQARKRKSNKGWHTKENL